MKIWNVYGAVVGTKYLGQVEAATREEALEKAADMGSVDLCHQCGPEVENAEIEGVDVEEVEGGPSEPND